MTSLDVPERDFFRDELRSARAAVLRDSENFMEIPLVLESLGSIVAPDSRGLYAYRDALASVARESPLSQVLPSKFPQYHRPFTSLYAAVRTARNELVHEGAHARQLTHRAVELALILEDALMTQASQAADLMVPSPEVAHPWEPLSFLRQKMLVNSFTFLPFKSEEGARGSWQLVSDAALAAYLRSAGGRRERKRRMAKRLGAAIGDGDIQVEEARVCRPDDPIEELIEGLNHRPWLVVDESDVLVGIVSAYDLL